MSEKMTLQQRLAIIICIFINTLDGFDVLVIAFAAPSLKLEWGLSPEAVGVLFSAGLLGMTLGAWFISPFADRYGRRPVTIICLCVITIGMFLAAISQTSTQLAAVRLFTGLGIGGMLASINTLVVEYSPMRLRTLMVSLLQSGYPLGAAVGGIISVFLIGEFGWRSLFWFGGGLSLVILPLAFIKLPESSEFLFHRGTDDALERGNQVRKKLGMEPLAELPDVTTKSKGMIKMIWGELRYQTILLWFCFFMFMTCWYFVANWTPLMLVDAGLNKEQGMVGGVLLSIGAIIGGLMLGYLSIRRNIFYLTRNYALLGGISLIAFALLANGLSGMMFFSTLIGVCVAGSMVGLYACNPQVYPAACRNTGLGWALGFGRGGAVIGPYAAGLLLGNDFTRNEIYIIFSTPMFVAMVALWLLARKQQYTVHLQQS